MEETTAVVISQSTAIATPVCGFDENRYTALGKLANIFARSDLVPTVFKGKPDSVFIVLDMADRMGLPPFAALQNISVIAGKPCFSAAAQIALANQTVFSSLGYEEKGEEGTDDYAVRAVATIRETGKIEKGAWISLRMAREEGWAGRNPKYKTMPGQMLRYRAATFLIRSLAPAALLGLPSDDEVLDTAEIVPEKTTRRAVKPSAAPIPDSHEDEVANCFPAGPRASEMIIAEPATTPTATSSQPAATSRTVTPPAKGSAEPAEQLLGKYLEMKTIPDGMKEKLKTLVGKLRAGDEKNLPAAILHARDGDDSKLDEFVKLRS